MDFFGMYKLKGLLELQRNQSIKRNTVYRETEVDELDAIKRLALHCFGDKGYIETRPDDVGFFYLGFYRDGKKAPRQIDHSRLAYATNVLRGTTYSELLEQARLLGLIRGKIELRKVHY